MYRWNEWKKKRKNILFTVCVIISFVKCILFQMSFRTPKYLKPIYFHFALYNFHQMIEKDLEERKKKV